jgi:hypothetical protein
LIQALADPDVVDGLAEERVHQPLLGRGAGRAEGAGAAGDVAGHPHLTEVTGGQLVAGLFLTLGWHDSARGGGSGA